jgi:hypothetical protein
MKTPSPEMVARSRMPDCRAVASILPVLHKEHAPRGIPAGALIDAAQEMLPIGAKDADVGAALSVLICVGAITVKSSEYFVNDEEVRRILAAPLKRDAEPSQTIRRTLGTLMKSNDPRTK